MVGSSNIYFVPVFVFLETETSPLGTKYSNLILFFPHTTGL